MNHLESIEIKFSENAGSAERRTVLDVYAVIGGVKFYTSWASTVPMDQIGLMKKAVQDVVGTAFDEWQRRNVTFENLKRIA